MQGLEGKGELSGTESQRHRERMLQRLQFTKIQGKNAAEVRIVIHLSACSCTSGSVFDVNNGNITLLFVRHILSMSYTPLPYIWMFHTYNTRLQLFR